MSRIKVVAGNWKMNKTVAETRELIAGMGRELNNVTGVEKVIFPPFMALLAAANLLDGTGIGLGAQTMHWEEKGAFTGEISPLMVREFCRYVLLGHSERRQYFGESDETVNKKTLSAQAHGLIPLVCVGESLADYESGQTGEVVRRQLLHGLKGVGAALMVAYEPIWAIGTGRASSAENAQQVHGQIIRPALVELFGAEAADGIRILYGGSVSAANAAEFFAQPDIDGALVGGASLKPADFVAIARAAA